MAGRLGVFLIELLRQENPTRAIYCESDNTNSLSEEAKDIMDKLNYKVSARMLYLRYSQFIKNESKFIIRYYSILAQLPYTPEWDGDSYVYHKFLV